jgi:alkaline phosphatase
MRRRTFFKDTALASAALGFLVPSVSLAGETDETAWFYRKKKAKNIIFLVSDGMSMGTLTMSDVFLRAKNGKGCNWLGLYRENKVKRALMDMASASSVITDSAAASSSWGGGVRVKNGRLNSGDNGEEYMPIWQKFKKSGKKAGCVTTVPITHATPAGFCVSSKSRGEQSEIATKYLDLRFDVMMGGGEKYFTQKEKGIDLFPKYTEKGFEVVKSKKEMMAANGQKPLLGVFDHEGLPYEIDRLNDTTLKQNIPSLAEMTQKAIELMKDHKEGFCLQVEGGKVDWAAHANDAPALIYDQVAFDEAIQVVMDFAEKDGETLVIITTDHGNANPGLYYGKDADKKFETLFTMKQSTTQLFSMTKKGESFETLKERIMVGQRCAFEDEEVKMLIKKFDEQPDTGTYNEYKLPYEIYANILRKHTNVHFGGTDHSADFTELAMFGPGSFKLPAFIKNTGLHHFMLEAAEVENKF